ncbi:MAG: hypothetical protein K0S21_3679, partial [Rhizobiaceae bacterium]|nr:hypothetical protein [Rhizobiaceae bacterium]
SLFLEIPEAKPLRTFTGLLYAAAADGHSAGLR